MSTQLSHLDCGQPQRYSQRWQMPSCGRCTRTGSPTHCTISMTFLFIDRAAIPADQVQLQVALCTCQTLGDPVVPDKVHFLTNKLSFLGIETDASSLELRLPEPKLMELCCTLHSWRPKRSCTKRELLPLIGQLHHTAAVVKPGHTFLHRLIDSSTTVVKLHHHIHLTSSAHADIEWWLAFLTRWNGISYLPPSDPHTSIELDASGSWGSGAIWGHHWFQIKWPDSWREINIELLPILVASAVWGREWSGLSICCWCDNAAVVSGSTLVGAEINI